jgi:hypothetical protein
MRNILFILLLATSASAQAQHRPGPDRMDWEGGADGRHILSFTPFCGIVAYDQFNPGVGLDYEYIFDKERGIGFHVPFALGYTGPEQDAFGNGYYKHTSYYAAPGIRFHTSDGRGMVDFATGPSVLVGNIHFSPVEQYSTPGFVRDPYNYSMVGLVVDNSLNFQRKHFLFGFDVRVGSLIERQENTRFFLHFGMHFGGKF